MSFPACGEAKDMEPASTRFQTADEPVWNRREYPRLGQSAECLGQGPRRVAAREGQNTKNNFLKEYRIMRIQQNIMSMNAYRNYSNNTSAVAKNL